MIKVLRIDDRLLHGQVLRVGLLSTTLIRFLLSMMG